MIIASWNVNSLKKRLDSIIDWLKHNNTDFLFLQEIKGLDEDIFHIFKEIGYSYYHVLQKGYNGVATISKHNCEITKTSLPGFIDSQARFLEVKLADCLFINVYMPNGNPIATDKYTYKLEWTNALYLYLKELSAANTNFIIGGDFNIAPKDMDVYSPKLLKNEAIVQKEARDLYFKMINLGLTDSLRFINPNTKQLYTWWDYRNTSFAKNNGLRIDHILLSPKMADKLQNAYVDKTPSLKDNPSDHTPVICVIN